MKLVKLALCAAALFGAQILASPADARRHWSTGVDAADQSAEYEYEGRGSARAGSSRRSTRAKRVRGGNGIIEHASLTGGSGAGPRPRKWCGWWMRTQLGGGPAYNLAWNWRSYGRSTSPQVGAVVVWRHHVGMIVGQASNGQWLVKSGNDGGAVRTRARSVSGAIFRI